MFEADEREYLTRVASVYTNGRKNPDGSKIIEGVKMLTTRGNRDVFVKIIYDQDGCIVDEEGRPFVDSLAKMFYSNKPYSFVPTKNTACQGR